MARLRLVLCVLAVASAAPSNSPAEYDTIVVGLGAAGATAAAALAAAGRRVLALEARAQPGGRVRTETFGNGIVELGAEWIHGTENSVTYDLTTKNNITTLPTPLNVRMLRSNGEETDEALVDELMEYGFQVVREQAPDPPEPVGNFTRRKIMEYITATKPDLLKDQDFIEQFFEFANLYVNVYVGSDDWNELTTDIRAEKLGGNQLVSWHRNGYNTFFEIMLNTYNNGTGLPNLEVKLNTEVTEITAPRSPADRVVVCCADGSSYEADTVIVTVSLGVLKERHATLFSEPLPEDKQTAIDKIGMGIIDKIIMSFDDIWWPQKNISFFGFMWKGEDRKRVAAEDRWTLWISGASPPMGASNILTMWINGNAAKEVETLPEEVVKTKCLELLQRFIGDNIGVKVPQPAALLRSTWYSNLFTRGSYSFDNIETPQYPAARAWLGAPLTDSAGAPRVLFAGEATSLNHFSTVHGASETGKREAIRILKSAESVE